MNVLIVGEQPSCRAHGVAFCRESASGRRLSELAGVADITEVAWTANVFADRLDGWSIAEARRKAGVILEMTPARRLIVCGARAARAFEVRRDPLLWEPIGRDRLIAWFPHPSGRNRYWNSAELSERARVFLREALDDSVWTPA